MRITSQAFADGESIPRKYTCSGEGTHPEVSFSEIPPGAKSLVLIVEDPDVPKSIRPDGMWDHWVVYNMPPETKGIPEGALPPGTLGVNSSGKQEYAGPCPPDREHRYFFKLFALDEVLPLGPGATKKAVEEATRGHVLSESQLIGVYNQR